MAEENKPQDDESRDGKEAGKAKAPESSPSVPEKKPSTPTKSASGARERSTAARPEGPGPAPSDPPRRGGRGLAVLALLVALLAAAGAGYVIWQDRIAAQPVEETPDWNRQIERRVSEAQSQAEETIAELRGEIDRLRTSISDGQSDLQDQLRGLDNRIGSAQARADAAADAAQRTQQALSEQIAALERRFEVVEKNVARLANEASDEDDRLLLAEAEFLMRLAGERLQLFEDPGSATEALRLALGHLQAVDDPLYASVRETLSTEIERLAQFDAPDRAEISGQLLHLADASGSWPLDQRRTVHTEGANVLEPEADEQGWWARMREVLSQVAVVHRDTGDATIMLTLQEQRLLRENVRLQLQLAQLAAVRGQAELYRAALETVEQWIDNYYAVDASAVSAALERIETLQAVEIDPQPPAIGQALRELRALRASADRAEGTP